MRRSTGGEWPRPGFTPEENRADLEGHEADFLARRGFTYTVLDPEVDDRQVALMREAGLRRVWSHPDRGATTLYFA